MSGCPISGQIPTAASLSTYLQRPAQCPAFGEDLLNENDFNILNENRKCIFQGSKRRVLGKKAEQNKTVA